MLNKFKEDLSLHDKGTPFEIEGMIFIVRRMNHNWERALVEARRNVMESPFVFDRLDDELEYRAIGEAMAEYLVADWKNVRESETGKDVRFNFGNACAIFCDRAYHSLVVRILNFASDKNNYLEKKLKENIEIAKK